MRILAPNHCCRIYMRNCPIATTPNEMLVGSNTCGFLGFPADVDMQCLNAARPLSCAPFFFLF
jgi:hypothetical protein